MSGRDDWRVSVPIGEDGEWAVKRFEITEHGASLHNMRVAWQPGMGYRTVRPGTYTRLLYGRGVVVMSDTDAEYHDHAYAIGRAKGRVLLHGLGLGCMLQAVLRKPEVEHVTVIEMAPEVIRLVAPHYLSMFGEDRLTILEGDALTWNPPKGARWDVVWHDIWDDICSDNLPDMKRLHRRYGRRAEWQGSWARELAEMNR